MGCQTLVFVEALGLAGSQGTRPESGVSVTGVVESPAHYCGPIIGSNSWLNRDHDASLAEFGSDANLPPRRYLLRSLLCVDAPWHP
jgi:hypothetical protein